MNLEPEALIPPGRGTATVVSTLSTAVGEHSFSVIGRGGGQEQEADLTLVVISPTSESGYATPTESLDLALGSVQGVTTTLSVPAGAFSQPTAVTLSWLSYNDMPTDDPPSGQAFVRTLRITSGVPLNAGQSVTLTIHYRDGETALLQEDCLRVFYWNELTQSWQSDGIQIVTVDPYSNIVVARLEHFTDFALSGHIAVKRIFLPMIIR
jgi:hypothetical protein